MIIFFFVIVAIFLIILPDLISSMTVIYLTIMNKWHGGLNMIGAYDDIYVGSEHASDNLVCFLPCDSANAKILAFCIDKDGNFNDLSIVIFSNPARYTLSDDVLTMRKIVRFCEGDRILVTTFFAKSLFLYLVKDDIKELLTLYALK